MCAHSQHHRIYMKCVKHMHPIPMEFVSNAIPKTNIAYAPSKHWVFSVKSNAMIGRSKPIICRCPNGLKTSGACVHSITALYALYYKLRGESILLKQHGVDGLDDIQWDGYESDSDTDRDSDGCECVSDSNSDNDLDGYQSDSDSNSDSDSDGYESDSNTESGSGSDSDSNCDADIDLENPLNTANDEVIVEAAVAIETSTSSVKVC
eukprot:761410_1